MLLFKDDICKFCVFLITYITISKLYCSSLRNVAPRNSCKHSSGWWQTSLHEDLVWNWALLSVQTSARPSVRPCVRSFVRACVHPSPPPLRHKKQHLFSWSKASKYTHQHPPTLPTNNDPSPTKTQYGAVCTHQCARSSNGPFRGSGAMLHEQTKIASCCSGMPLRRHATAQKLLAERDWHCCKSSKPECCSAPPEKLEKHRPALDMQRLHQKRSLAPVRAHSQEQPRGSERQHTQGKLCPACQFWIILYAPCAPGPNRVGQKAVERRTSKPNSWRN